METVARLAVVALVVLPLVVLVVRGPRRDPLTAAAPGRLADAGVGSAADDDADARRLRTDLATLAAHLGEQRRPPRGEPDQPEAPSRFSADIAS